jgi:hypothetical protein
VIVLESSLDGREDAYDPIRDYLHRFEFILGGSWDYDHGYFDRTLDEGHKVWLRIPFQVTHGALDGDSESTDAIIRIGSPFVLKHVYNEGLDKEAQVRTYGALIDQFQEPLEDDARIENIWVDKAKELLQKVESGMRGM